MIKKYGLLGVAVATSLFIILTLSGTGCAPSDADKEPAAATGSEQADHGKQDTAADKAGADGSYPRVVTDSTGRIVTIEKPLQRVVIIFPQVYEALRTMGLSSDLVVGVAKNAQPYDLAFFPELADVPSVGGRWDPDVEAILGLQPDAVFLHPSSGNRGGNELDEATKALENAGVAVLRFGCNEMESYAEEVGKLGYIFDRSEEAEEHLAWRDEILSLVAEKIERLAEEEKPNVYFMPAFDEGVYYIYGGLNYLEQTGGNDIFPDQPPNYMPIDTEEIIKRNPDLIVRVAPMGSGGIAVAEVKDLQQARQEIMERPELQNVPAVKNGEVYVITDQILSFFMFSGNRHFMQLVYQAKWFHPELFKDVEPKKIFQEYLTKYQGLDVDLAEQGVFVYHPEKHPEGH